MQKINIPAAIPSLLKATLVYNTASVGEFIPEEKKIEIKMEGGVDASSTNRILIPAIDLNNPVNDCGGTGISSKDSGGNGLLTIFLLH